MYIYSHMTIWKKKIINDNGQFSQHYEPLVWFTQNKTDETEGHIDGRIVLT